MNNRFAAALFLTLCVPSARAEKEPFKTMHVADLAKALESATPPVVYDVNVASTRENVGIIPGAKLLSSSSKYDVAKELPADKKTPLVFYCANTMCTASHSAAKKAIAAGYVDVSVMVDGIYGWKKAGRPRAALVSPPQSLAPKAVAALVKTGGAVIVDVREEEERHEVVPGARWMPMSRASDEKSWADFAAALPKDKTVVFHCAAGMRAKRAAEKLSTQGFKTAYFEGPDQWKAAGLPVEKGPADQSRP
ncbi:MAG: rhodanese-like domain-containing protein [Elusimicrobiota bacterium]